MTKNKNFLSKSLLKGFKFYKEVKFEISKVVWPGKREVLLTTVFVFIFTAIASFWLAIVDTISYKFIQFITGMG